MQGDNDANSFILLWIVPQSHSAAQQTQMRLYACGGVGVVTVSQDMNYLMSTQRHAVYPYLSQIPVFQTPE